MPWSTPTLRDVRSLVRDAVHASLPGADANVPNSVLRVLSDNQGALCHLTLQYVDWLALQLLPDTAEAEWLDRHGDIWLVNADGSTGRKLATLAYGTASFQGTIDGSIVPAGTQLQSGVGMPVGSGSPNEVISFELLEDIVTSDSGPVPGNIRALDPGSFGNLPDGSSLSIGQNPVPGVSNEVMVIHLTGGVDTESDDDLRARILFRIQQPPMGGDANDYVAWALSCPGVTRAWAATEMGIGTITVRFMMDDLRADQGGFPTNEDIAMVTAYIDSVRPITTKDRWVLAPVPEPINFTIRSVIPDTDEVRADIEVSVKDMLRQRAAPAHSINGQLVPATTIYVAWVSEAIMNAAGVVSFTLDMLDHVMPYNGSLGVLGTILYER